jgi:cytochrome c biogenesis protein CcmG/thiol:disulfide interchange protein DsbE
LLLVALAAVAGGALLLGSGLGNASPKLADESAGSPLLGRPAPALSGKTLQGAHFSLANDHSAVTFVNIWASWCTPCRQELPLVADTAAQWAGSGVDATVVTVDTKDGPVPARDMLRRSGAENLPTLLDPQGDRAVAWGATGVPETFVVDGHDIVRARHVGPVTRRWLEQQATQWSHR